MNKTVFVLGGIIVLMLGISFMNGLIEHEVNRVEKGQSMPLPQKVMPVEPANSPIQAENIPVIKEKKPEIIYEMPLEGEPSVM